MTHYAISHPTARKSHRCTLCGRSIRPSEQYVRGAGMDGSSAWSWKECAHCDTIRDLARNDRCESEYDSDLIAEWEPRTFGLLRMKALWRKHWTRADGSLYPVPEKVWRTDGDGFGFQVDVSAGEIRS